MRVLLLDFGGVCLRTPFELRRGFEQRFDLPDRTLTWTGPFDADADPLWQKLEAGDLTEREYWAQRAPETGEVLGESWQTSDLMARLFDLPESDLIRPELPPLVADAHAGGLRVAILSNDLGAFHDQAWIDRLAFLRMVDKVIDLSFHQVLKPDPAAYGAALRELHVEGGDVLFVDDQPANVAGAFQVGITALDFDVTDPAVSVSAARRLLGLDS